MTARTVLVSGASIAGPALAFWLRRHGFEPTVVERAPQLRTGGYKIDLRGAAIDVAQRMGILDDVRRADTDMQTMSVVHAGNRRLATIPADLFMGRTHDDVELMRGDLSALLYQATKDDVEYVFGDTITGMAEGPDGVTATFEKAQPRTFDLVIGADGLHSAVRTLAFGDESRFVRSLDHGVAIFTVPNHLGLDREELVYVERGRTLNLYSAGHEAKALFLFDRPAEIDRRDVPAQQAFLRERFGEVGWQAPRLLDEMASAPDFYFDTVSQVVMPEWTRGRVALVGDAGYCPSLASGQGTSLALVGAYVLAGELAAAGGDHAIAFTVYEREMREFVAKNQKLGRDGVKRMVAKGRFSAWFSVQMMRLLPRLPWRDAVIEKIVGPIQEAATAIELKEYVPTTLAA